MSYGSRRLTMHGVLSAGALVLSGCGQRDTAKVPTAAEWANATPAQREAYMRAIAASQRPVGMTDEELVEWLGEPDAWGDRWSYDVDRHGASSRAALIVYFTKGETVERAAGSSLSAGE